MAKNIPWTHERFLEFMKENKPDFEVLGQYINNRTPVLVRCRCGNETKMYLRNLATQKNCLKCQEVNRGGSKSYVEIDGIVYQSILEAAETLKVSRQTIYKKIKDPKFENYIKIEVSLQKYFENRIFQHSNEVSSVGEYKGMEQKILIKYKCGHEVEK